MIQRMLIALVVVHALSSAPGHTVEGPSAELSRASIVARHCTPAMNPGIPLCPGTACAYPDGCDPFGIARDVGRDRIWIVSQGCPDGTTLKSFAVPPPGDTFDCVPIDQCAIPGTGSGNGITVLPNGNLLIADFNGDLVEFDDVLLEVDPDAGCSCVRFWALDDTTCPTCVASGGVFGEKLDEVIAIDFELSLPASRYQISLTDLDGFVSRRLVLDTAATGCDPAAGDVSALWATVGPEHDIDFVGTGLDFPSAPGDPPPLIAGVHAPRPPDARAPAVRDDCAYINSMHGTVWNQLAACQSPTDHVLSLITGIEALGPVGLADGAFVCQPVVFLQADARVSPRQGQVYSLELQLDECCSVEASAELRGTCVDGGVLEIRASGVNLSPAVADFDLSLTDPIQLPLQQLPVAPGVFELIVPIPLPANCPPTAEFTATLNGRECNADTVLVVPLQS